MRNLAENTSHPQQGAPEREQRFRRLINVEIETENGARFSAIVTNISKHGLGAKTGGILQPFKFIDVIKDGYGRVHGEVRWVDGQNFGVLFSEPVNVEMFNFSDKNEQGHFVPEAKDGHVWKGFHVESSTQRPGVTSQFSKKYLDGR